MLSQCCTRPLLQIQTALTIFFCWWSETYLQMLSFSQTAEIITPLMLIFRKKKTVCPQLWVPSSRLWTLDRITRSCSQELLPVPAFKNNPGQKSFFHNSTNVWHTIPFHIRTVSSHTQFRLTGRFYWTAPLVWQTWSPLCGYDTGVGFL